MSDAKLTHFVKGSNSNVFLSTLENTVIAAKLCNSSALAQSVLLAFSLPLVIIYKTLIGNNMSILLVQCLGYNSSKYPCIEDMK